MKTNLGTNANLISAPALSEAGTDLAPQGHTNAAASDFDAEALNLNAVFLEDLMYTLLVHRTKGPRRHLEGDRAIELRDVDLLGHEVRALNALGLTLRVGNIVARHAALARHLTNSGHFYGPPVRPLKVETARAMVNTHTQCLDTRVAVGELLRLSRISLQHHTAIRRIAG